MLKVSKPPERLQKYKRLDSLIDSGAESRTRTYNHGLNRSKGIAVSTKLSTLLRALPIELSLHTKQDLVEPNHLAVNANPLRQRLLASYNLRKLSYSWANNWI